MTEGMEGGADGKWEGREDKVFCWCGVRSFACDDMHSRASLILLLILSVRLSLLFSSSFWRRQ